MEYYLSMYTNIPSYRPAGKDVTDFLMMQAQPGLKTSHFILKKGEEMSTFRNPILLKIKGKTLNNTVV
jgi:hypothetical protein